MKVYPPSAALAPFVREFMVVDVQDETTRLRLPEPGLVLGVRYAGWAGVLAGEVVTRLPDVSLAAMTATARQMRTSAGGGVVLARFHPGGAAPFFAQPLHQLFGATVALHDLLPRAQVDELQSRVQQAAGDRPARGHSGVVPAGAAATGGGRSPGGRRRAHPARRPGGGADPGARPAAGHQPGSLREALPPGGGRLAQAAGLPAAAAPRHRPLPPGHAARPGWRWTRATSTSRTSTGSSAPSPGRRPGGCCAPAAH